MSTNKQGRFSAGVDHSYSETDLELENGTWVEHLDGEFFDSGKAVSLTLKNFETNRAYANLGYGISDNVDVFVRLGVADARFYDHPWGDNEEFESRAEPAIGAGIRATFYESGNLSLGGLLQTNWARFDGQLDSPYWPAADFVEVDIAEVQIAVGPTLRLNDQIAVYGGPFFHFIDGTFEDHFNEAAEGGLINSRYSWDVKESSNFGAYLGARFNLDENRSFNIEYQHTSAADAIGLSFAWRF
jgi:hypothetical protein